ncbi:MAG: VWA domain-containing protein [Acidobacteria bacterium]|nr:VWA domain-containing protein [Acidobacteriota bacterium]
MSRAIPMMEMPNERLRGVGILSAEREGKKALLPLAGVKINAQVADRVATVIMAETFHNPYSEHLETVYIFPLPGGAAVNDFEMRVGERVIKGKVEERGEARKQYQQALDQGKQAALMEKERDDVFTIQVGNIPPNEEISVKITYSERLPFFEDGRAEIRLPLVVAPRYIPGQALEREPVGEGIEQDTNLVPDASRITPPRLAEGFDPKVALSIDVSLMWDESDGLGEIRNLCCSQHATQTSIGREGVRVSLAYDNELLNRDFVLRWTLSGRKLRPSLLFHKDLEGKTYGMLSLIPPYNEGQNKQARDIVFVLDRSGSMQGIKISSASRACALLINTLGPDDRFAIQIFDNRVEWFNASHYQKDGHFIPADSYGIEQGEKYLRTVTAEGGTEMYSALSQAITALESRKNINNRVPTIVMLTDGEVGNESHILKEMQQRLNDSRLFTIGIDTAVNQGFLQRLADVGRGTANFVTPGAQLEEALVNIGREIGVPLVVNLRIEDIDTGLELESIAPTKIVDLFSGRATTTFFVTQKIGKIHVKGNFPNGDCFEAVVNGKEISLQAIAQLWAKTKINDLEDRYRIDLHLQAQIKREIISLSIQHKILTKFTAFIAVDHEEIVNKENLRRKVVQPVEMPAQWEMKVAPSSPAPYQPTKMIALMPQAPPAQAASSFISPSVSIAPGAPRRSARAERNDANLTSCGMVAGNAASNLDKKAASLSNQLNNTPPLADLSDKFDSLVFDSDDELCELGLESVSTTELLSETKAEPKEESKAGVKQKIEASLLTDKEEFETHYNLGLAYKDMKLFDDAIAEFQLAFKFSTSDKDVFKSTSMIAHSFLSNKTDIATMFWYKRAIETAIKIFISAYSDGVKGNRVSFDDLEKVQKALLELINAIGLLEKLPKTVSFFSTSFLELSMWLERGYKEKAFSSNQIAFEDVIKEIDANFNTSLFAIYESEVTSKLKDKTTINTGGETQSKNVVEGDKKDSFWDSSI